MLFSSTPSVPICKHPFIRDKGCLHIRTKGVYYSPTLLDSHMEKESNFNKVMLYTTTKASQKHHEKNFDQLKFSASQIYVCGGWISRSTTIMQSKHSTCVVKLLLAYFSLTITFLIALT